MSTAGTPNPDTDPPAIFREAFDPLTTRTVASILQLPRPRRLLVSDVVVHAENPLDWYSEEPPSIVPTYTSQIVLPSTRACLYMKDALSQAIKRGCQSIKHPSQPNETLPLWVPQIFRWADALLKKQAAWERHLEWLEEAESVEGWEEDFGCAVRDALQRCPWLSGLPGLQEGQVASSSGFAILLSNDWLNSDTLECMLDVVRSDMPNDSTTCVATSWLGQAIQKSPSGRTATVWGEKLEAYDRILFPMNVEGLHWIAVEVDVSKSLISFGDSLPSITRPYLPNLIQAIKTWLRPFYPGTSWRVSLTGLNVAVQKDDSSCGITAINAIHRIAYAPTLPWRADRAFFGHAYYFQRCIEVGERPLVSVALINSFCNSTY